MGRENLPLLQAMMVEEERLADSDINTPDGLETYLHASYKRRGCYADQLERYFSVFERNQILVLGNNQLLCEPAATVNQAFDFLSLPPMSGSMEFPKKNTGHRQPVPDTVYNYLEEYFAPHNKRLFNTLGETIDW